MPPKLWHAGPELRAGTPLPRSKGAGELPECQEAQVAAGWHHPTDACHTARVALASCLLSLWKPSSLQLSPSALVGSQIHKMYKCKLVDFIKILVILCSFCSVFCFVSNKNYEMRVCTC